MWIGAVCALHLAAMWACCAIWVTCAQSTIASMGATSWVASAPVTFAMCAIVLVPLSTLGGTEALSPPLATATLTTVALMCTLLLWALLAPPTAAPIFSAPPRVDETVSIRTAADLRATAASATADDDDSVDDDAAAAAAFTSRYVFNSTRFGPAFSTLLFAFILQQSVPSLVRAAAQPHAMRTALAAALATVAALYLVLSTSAALYFGDRTNRLITENFADFRAGAPAHEPVALWARIVSHWIRLLPLFTTTAAFPLFNRVLATNLAELLPPRHRSVRVAAALCALPPFIGTACVRDTSRIFAICGLSGFAVVFFVPAALQVAAMRASVARWGEAGRCTPHTVWLSKEPVVLTVAALSGAAFVQNLLGVLGVMGLGGVKR